MKIAYFSAYHNYQADNRTTGEGITIMVNAYNENNELLIDEVEEEFFEGGNISLADLICEDFNKLRTKDINDFSNIRATIFNKYNYKLPSA